MSRRPPPHGTRSRYNNNGCRCDECRQANSDDRYRRRNGISRRQPVTDPADRLAFPTWRDDAACAGMDPDVFFPIAETRSAQEAVWAKERAVQVCRSCQVTDACLAYSLDRDETDGIWGGSTPDDRQALRRLRKRRVRPDPDDLEETG